MGSMVAQAMAVYSKMNSLPTVPEERELEELSHRSEVNINLDWTSVVHITRRGVREGYGLCIIVSQIL